MTDIPPDPADREWLVRRKLWQARYGDHFLEFDAAGRFVDEWWQEYIGADAVLLLRTEVAIPWTDIQGLIGASLDRARAEGIREGYRSAIEKLRGE